MRFCHWIYRDATLWGASFVFAALLPAFLIAIQAKLFIEDRFERESPPFFLAVKIVLHLLALFRLAQRADTQADLSLSHVHVDDFGFDFIADLEQGGGLIYPFRAQLRDMHEPF